MYHSLVLNITFRRPAKRTTKHLFDPVYVISVFERLLGIFLKYTIIYAAEILATMRYIHSGYTYSLTII